jgi:hypothetical protein
MIPVQDLGWMAGVLDLKGRIQVKNNRQRATRQIVLLVESSELLVIRRLARMTGSRAEAMVSRPLKEWMRRGCNDHCPEAHVHVGDDRIMPAVSRWTLTGAGAAVVLTALLPFLTVERGWEEAINEIMASTPLTGQGATAVLGSLNRLRELGWELPERFEAAVESRDLAVVAA